jgi:hypothetical protein
MCSVSQRYIRRYRIGMDEGAAREGSKGGIAGVRCAKPQREQRSPAIFKIMLKVLVRVTVFSRSGASLIVSLAPTGPVAVCIATPVSVTLRSVDRRVVTWVQ